MIRVGLLIDRWEPSRGGAERALAELARWLDARGMDVRVFAREADAPPTAKFHRVGVDRRVLESRGAYERRLGDALLGAAGSERCDVTVGVRHLPRVDLYWPHAGSHFAALRGMRSARAGAWLDPSRVRVAGRHRAFLDLERELIADGGARRIACVSTLVRDEIAERYPGAASLLVLVPNGVDTERFHPRERSRAGARLRAQLDLPEHVPLLAFGARNPALKGLAELLDALATLRASAWKLLVAGPRERAPWLRRARRAGLEPGRVTVLSDVDPVALASAADLCVLPTWRDACPLVVLEALSSGTPVVTTRQCGAAEAIRSEDAGSVIDAPSDIAALAGAIAARLGRTVDRDLVRASVRGRERDAWLASLERLVRDLAARS